MCRSAPCERTSPPRDSAVETLVRTLGGGVPTAATTASARYADDRKEIRWEVRSAVAGAPGVRLLRIEMRAFRSTAGPPVGPASLAYSTGTEPPRPVPPGAWLELQPAPRGVTVVQAWAEPAAAGPARGLFVPSRSSGSRSRAGGQATTSWSRSSWTGGPAPRSPSRCACRRLAWRVSRCRGTLSTSRAGRGP